MILLFYSEFGKDFMLVNFSLIKEFSPQRHKEHKGKLKQD